MHRLLAKQWAKSIDASGVVDLDKLMGLVSAAYEETDHDRRRTDRSIALMVEELSALNDQLEQLVTQRTAELELTRNMLTATLENVDRGIIMVDPKDRLTVCNSRSAQLLGLPYQFLAARPQFLAVVERQALAGEFALEPAGMLEQRLKTPAARSPAIYEQRRPGGLRIEVRTILLDDGSCVRTYSDVTEQREREDRLAAAEADYRSLFENAVAGIYRSTPDGRQLRANPALARFNGYETEAELLEAVRDIAKEWYVDPSRREQFRQAIERDGRIDDFVSEVYRHRTRERVWISETAWLVRAADGSPVYYEGTVTDCTERMRARNRLAYLANHDPLTGALTRASFLEALQGELAELARDGWLALYCIDLDRFKEVNDRFGHPAGDALLVMVSERLRSEFSAGTLLARLGGDEFAILQRGAGDRDRARLTAERICVLLADPFTLENARVQIGASVGVVMSPFDGLDPEDLMKCGDLALYKAKSLGRSRHQFFDLAMAETLLRRRMLEVDLRGAAQRGELEAFLQPIVDISTGAIREFEALMRWRHPVAGLLAPDSFIPIAEETGLIVEIGAWMLNEACRTAARAGGEFSIAVNLSPVQFRHGSLVETVRRALADSGLPARRLALEITESVLLLDDVGTLSAIRALRDLGVRIALDDFGAGNSSLGYLQRFSFDILKIDRSFVTAGLTNSGNAKLIRAVIALGRDLGTVVIVEGIETEDQRARLQSFGAEVAQGYLFGKPAPAAHWLASLEADAESGPKLLSVA